ncbi:MFS transporter [Photobacterium sp. 2_MG-2023]|uniref:MFS transporter n=1 Tax=Photobacterium sp. 2_MG-2023 TaxID=3062663 RepID=UPI0026E3AA25|nr:MFS transporter [Photobacterium sp. 2_MG-2023]MDO6582959.1 MFS transporter [Photobacterium sp. 2_MG-2023]
MNSARKSILAVIFSVSVFSLTYGLSAPLITLQLADMAYGESTIGLNAAMHALGVFAIAPFLPKLFRQFTPLTLMCTSLVAIAVLFLLFPYTPVPVWFVLRFGLGVFTEIIMVLTETWLNDSTVEQARGKTMALYTAGMSLGFASGPLILALMGSDNAFPFIAGAAISLLAVALIVKAGMVRQPGEHVTPTGYRQSLQLAFLAIVATALNAAIEVAGMNFLSLYAMNLGWVESQATLLISVLMFGAIVLQLPLGWLADKMDRRLLMTILATISALGALIWPFLLPIPWLAYCLLFVWGGVFVGIYTVAITWVGSQFRGAQLAGIYAAMSVAWGTGALFGPLLGGLAMDLTTHGLPYLTAILCALFAILSLRKTAAALIREQD